MLVQLPLMLKSAGFAPVIAGAALDASNALITTAPLAFGTPELGTKRTDRLQLLPGSKGPQDGSTMKSGIEAAFSPKSIWELFVTVTVRGALSWPNAVVETAITKEKRIF